MARILQIRRGDATQNDNFTGLPGEISFDTDAKTLRVHDGERLGGYPLARTDQIPDASTGGTFDINSVSDEFWADKIPQFTPEALTKLTGRAVPLSNSSYIEYIFGTDKPAIVIQAALVCQTPEAGYSIGDECHAFGIGTYMSPLFNTNIDDNGLHIKIAIGSQNFWVAHKSTGQQTTITNDNWRLQFTVYC